MSKTENYTAKQTAAIISAYTDAPSDMSDESVKLRDAVIAELSETYGKPVRSIRSKLVNEKVYIAKQAKSKVTGEVPEKKEVMAERIVAAVGKVTIGDRTVSLNAESLAKANKSDLAILFHIFNSEIVDEAEAEAEADENVTDQDDISISGETADENDSQEDDES
jgi:hypothetical protein